jgi:hypothetical protein
MFKNGLFLNTVIFNQARIKDAHNDQSLCIFNPSHLITGQIFRSVLTCHGYRIIQGQYGVSKTFAIILLSQLT